MSGIVPASQPVPGQDDVDAQVHVLAILRSRHRANGRSLFPELRPGVGRVGVLLDPPVQAIFKRLQSTDQIGARLVHPQMVSAYCVDSMNPGETPELGTGR